MNPSDRYMPDGERLLPISEFSEMTGVGQDTLHFWDSVGLLRPMLRNVETGVTYYAQDHQETAAWIVANPGLAARNCCCNAFPSRCASCPPCCPKGKTAGCGAKCVKWVIKITESV